MHEFSLCEGILKQVSLANHGRLDNVSKVTISVGKLAGVDLDSLGFWFPVVATKVNASQLKLQIEEVAAVALCNSCGHEFKLINLFAPCLFCGVSGGYQLLTGRELLVKSFSLVN